jgi:ABC-2 type transport system permease protein
MIDEAGPGTALRLTRAFAAGVRSGVTDFTTLYTWWSWTFGWLVRVVSQVASYGFLGRLIGSPAQTRYLMVGGSVLACAAEAMLACASTVNERRGGTLGLIAGAPSGVFPVLAGRGVQWLPSGVVTSLFCLLVVGPAFGLAWSPVHGLAVAGLVVLTALSTYCLGLTLGALVLAFPELRNVVGTVITSGLAVVCGVVVPLGSWPLPIRVAGSVVPLTYTLQAVRLVVDGGPAGLVLRSTALAILAAVGWFLLAWLVVNALIDASRRAGTIEFGG